MPKPSPSPTPVPRSPVPRKPGGGAGARGGKEKPSAATKAAGNNAATPLGGGRWKYPGGSIYNKNTGKWEIGGVQAESAAKYAADPSLYMYSATPQDRSAFNAAMYNAGMVPTGPGAAVVAGAGTGAGAGAGAGAEAGAGAGGDGTYENIAGYQPDARYALDALRARTEGDLGAGRAIDVAGGKIREAGIGLERESTANLARRGALGATGVGLAGEEIGAEGLRRTGDRERVQRAINAAATDISLGREAQRDDLYRSILGGGVSLGNLGIAERGLNLEQQLGLDRLQLERERNAIAREAAAQSQLAGMMQLIGGLGIGSGGGFGMGYGGGYGSAGLLGRIA